MPYSYIGNLGNIKHTHKNEDFRISCCIGVSLLFSICMFGFS